MNNRREFYRLSIDDAHALAAEIHESGGESWAGSVKDLSLGGALIRCDEPIEGDSRGRPWILRLALTNEVAPLVLLAQLVRWRAEGSFASFRFSRAVDPRTHAATEKRLWRFLMGQQTQRRRRRLSAG